MDLQAIPAEPPAFGVFTAARQGARVGFRTAVGVVDLAELADTRSGRSLRSWRGAFAQPYLNDFMALGRDAWSRCLEALESIMEKALDSLPLVPFDELQMRMPFLVRDFVDFYACRPHAETAGNLFRPGSGLPLCWPYVPLGYHSRAGSVVVSGSPVRRPMGQYLLEGFDGSDPASAPVYAETQRLDFELELGFVIGTPSDGSLVSPEDALDHIFGVVLLNDWSARDIQAFENQPLGPFLGKAFATSMGAWVVPLQSLMDRRVPATEQTPPPLDHLRGLSPPMVFDIDLTAAILVEGMDDPDIICRTNSRYLYWSAEQHVAHLTSGGVPLRTGDLLGTGTISGTDQDARGCMLELSNNGTRPIRLSDGSERTFINDGDEVIITADGLGSLRSRVTSAAPLRPAAAA